MNLHKLASLILFATEMGFGNGRDKLPLFVDLGPDHVAHGKALGGRPAKYQNISTVGDHLQFMPPEKREAPDKLD